MTVHLNLTQLRSTHHDDLGGLMLFDGGQYVNRTLEEQKQTEWNYRFLTTLAFVFSESFEAGRKK